MAQIISELVSIIRQIRKQSFSSYYAVHDSNRGEALPAKLLVVCLNGRLEQHQEEHYSLRVCEQSGATDGENSL